MGYTVDVFDGVATLLAGAGIGTYHPDGSAYTDGQTGIVYKAMLPTPDRLIVLTPYTLTDEPEDNLSQLGLQVRCRGTQDPRDVDNLADSAFELLHNLKDVWFGSVHVIQLLRKTSVSMGQDDLKRWDRADGYYLDVDMPATANRPDGGWQ